MPFLTIVIPTKNEEENLPRLLMSIRAQTFSDYEIVVADASSTDKTREIARSYGARVVDGDVPGPGRNRGAAVAMGHVILFLDADVTMTSTKFLSENLEEMKRKGANVATCLVKPVSRNPVDKAMHEGFDETVVFAEDHDYVQRAEKAGYRFRVLRSQPIAVSVRRLDKDGRLGIAMKYMMAELHMMVKGPYKKLPYEYEMGGEAFKDEKSPSDEDKTN